MKKILIVHTNYRYLGGEDTAVKNQIELLKKFYEVKVIYFRQEIIKIVQKFYQANLKSLILILYIFIIPGLKLRLGYLKYLIKKIKIH